MAEVLAEATELYTQGLLSQAARERRSQFVIGVWSVLAAGICLGALVYLPSLGTPGGSLGEFLGFLKAVAWFGTLAIGAYLAFQAHAAMGRFRELTQSMENVRKGQEGEREVADALESLPDQYAVINGWYVGKPVGDIDHIVFGGRAILAIETKAHSGTFRIDGNRWTKVYNDPEGGRTGTFDMPSSPSDQAEASADYLEDLLTEIGVDVPIQPLVVLASPKPITTVRGAGVPVVAAEAIRKAIPEPCGRNGAFQQGRVAQALLDRIEIPGYD